MMTRKLMITVSTVQQTYSCSHFFCSTVD